MLYLGDDALGAWSVTRAKFTTTEAAPVTSATLPVRERVISVVL
jgi:hypothetical protein